MHDTRDLRFRSGSVGSARPADPPTPIQPPASNTGGKHAEPAHFGVRHTRNVGIDWLSVVADEARWESERDWWSRRIGEPWQASTATQGYRKGIAWADGSRLYWDQVGTARTCCLSLPGSCLAAMTGPERVSLLAEFIERGMRATRLDLAIDYRAVDDCTVDLLDEVVSACRSGELVGFQRHELTTVTGGAGDGGRTIYLGRRGKNGSGRSVCLYDKGIETGTDGPNRWIRWEARFSGKVAHEAACRIVESIDEPPDDPNEHPADETMLAFALGVCDFREPIDGLPEHRRPRCDWWIYWLAGVQTCTVKLLRKAVEFDAYQQWVRTQVAPRVIAMARLLAVPSGQVFEWLTEGVEPSPELLRSRPVRQGVVAWRSRT